MEKITQIFLLCVLVFLCLCMLTGLVRTIRGPRVADRIVGINLIGSLSTAALAILAVMIGEVWLLDVCLIYCFISFLTVVIIAKISVDNEKEKEGRNE